MYEELPINITEEELIKWVVQKKKVNDEIYKDIRNRILNNLLFPNYENENLYREYEELEILNCKIKEGRKLKLKKVDINKNEIIEELKEKNTLVNDIKSKVKTNNENLKIEEIKDVVLNQNFRDIDTIITINNEYLIVLCEDTNIHNYYNKVKSILKEQNKAEIEDILEVKYNLINEEYLKNNVVFVTINNDNKLLELTKGYEDIHINRINRSVLIETIYQFLNENKGTQNELLVILEYIKNKYETIERLEDKELYKTIVSNNSIDVGTKFKKSYTCFNCFYPTIKMFKMYGDYEKNIYDEIYYTQKPISNLKSKKFDIEVWIADTTNGTDWGNIIKENRLIEVCNKKFDELLKFKKLYRYLFIKKKDNIYNEYLEFMGVYYLDTEETTNERRMWKRLDINSVTLNIEQLEKEIEKFEGIVVVEKEMNKNIENKKVKTSTKLLNAK